jgi:hypothetical protein
VKYSPPVTPGAMMKPPGNSAAFSLKEGANCTSTWEAFIQRIDGLEQIIAPRGESFCEDRVGGIGAVKHLEAMFFTGNVCIEQPNPPVELVDHVDNLRCLSFRSRARIKMTLVFHGMLQNKPSSRDQRGLRISMERESQEPCQPRRSRRLSSTTKAAGQLGGFFLQ